MLICNARASRTPAAAPAAVHRPDAPGGTVRPAVPAAAAHAGGHAAEAAGTTRQMCRVSGGNECSSLKL